MAGKWWAFVPSRVVDRDKPQVTQMANPQPWAHPTRSAAIKSLRKTLEAQEKAAREKAAELGRALARLRELEEEP